MAPLHNVASSYSAVGAVNFMPILAVSAINGYYTVRSIHHKSVTHCTLFLTCEIILFKKSYISYHTCTKMKILLQVIQSDALITSIGQSYT